MSEWIGVDGYKMVTWNGTLPEWCASINVLTWWYTHWWFLPCSIILAEDSVISHQSGINVTEIKCCTPHRSYTSTDWTSK